MNVIQTEIEHEFLNECSEDFVGLWSLVRETQERNTSWSSEEIKNNTLFLLEKLLKEKKIVAGYPNKSEEFVPWKDSPMEIIRKIKFEWDKLGRFPDIGDIVWFTSLN